MSPVSPQRPLDERWEPDLVTLREEFSHIINIDLSLRRFRAFYSEGQTARNWQGKFELWVLGDVERAGTRHGSDDMGTPYSQRKAAPDDSERITREQEDLIDLAVRSARERSNHHE